MSDPAKYSSYRTIFKSTALIGGTQVIKIVIGIAQTKVLALLLGTSGIGLAGMYLSAIGLIGTLTGFGIGSAGVRQIAEAAGTGNQVRVARTVATLRRTSRVSGLLGMLLVLVFARPLSRMTFGTVDYAGGIALVSLTLLFGGIAAGQSALLQGLRRLRDLAACNVLGSLFGAVASVALVWWWRERGVAPYLVAGAAFGILTSWWYARRVEVERVRLSWGETVREARPLLSMGAAFVTMGLLSTSAAYLIRILIIRQLGMNAVGLFTATATLSSVYVGVVLGAMGADFYPRLTALARDHQAMNRLVNEQTEMGLLITLPGILATLVLAPWVLRIFYSEAFVPAADIIRWQILGVGLRVVSWPMGYVQLAKGMSRLVIATETVFSVLQVALTYVAIRWWGLVGCGIAFAALYAVYTVGMLAVCRHVSGFGWTPGVAKVLTAGALAIVSVLVVIRYLPGTLGLASGLVITALAGVGCVIVLQRSLNIDPITLIVSKFRSVKES